MNQASINHCQVYPAQNTIASARENLGRSRAWAEISSGALIHNARIFAPKSREGIMAVVKANAYGHGAPQVSRILYNAGIRHFCVASLSEGIQLREQGICGEILILGYTPPDLADQISSYRLTQAVIDETHGYMLAKYARTCPICVHIAVDTGMHRLGLSWDAPEKIAALFNEKQLKITGVFSHLCVADSPSGDDRDFTLEQFRRFDQVIENLHKRGLTGFKTHIQSSYGVLNYGQFTYDYSRIGIALYGVYSTSTPGETKDVHLIPAMTIKARVARVLSLQAGESLGYGRAYTAPSPMKAAVLSIGYADGIPRNLDDETNAFVWIQGQKAPIIGRICMDQLFVDVTHISPIRPGMEAVIMGTDPATGAHIDAAWIAGACRTISNEILSRLGDRLERIYI